VRCSSKIHTERVAAFPLQQWSLEGVAVLLYTYVVYLVRSSSWLWIAITFLASVGATFVVLHSWERYVANPTVVALDKGYRQWSALYPAVTTCSLQNLDSKQSELEIKK
jgi:hypothetical protein